MDPRKLAAALIARDPNMSPDLAMRIATNLTAPNNATGRQIYEQMYPGLFAQPKPPSNGYGTQANGYDVIDDSHWGKDRLVDPRQVQIAREEQQEHAAIDVPHQPAGPVALARAFLDKQAATARQRVLTNRDALQAHKQRAARYHELMAKSYSGQQITREERSWLEQFNAAQARKR